MSWVRPLVAVLLLLATLIETPHSYEPKMRTMSLINGRWWSEKHSRVSKQELVNAILSDVTKPVFFPKGNKNIIFCVNPKLHYRGLQFGEFFMKNDVETYIEKQMKKSPYLSTKVEVITHRLVSVSDERAVMKLSRRQPFSILLPQHDRVASTLIRVLLGFDTAEQFVSASVYLRDRVNVELFVYSFSVALLNHPEFRKVKLPPLINTMPRKFIDGATFNHLYEQVINQIQAQIMDAIHIKIPAQYAATNKHPEHKVAYFREDLEVNIHHWHWHSAYSGSDPDINVRDKERRGELFYFMHQQMIARYDFERLSNRMARVSRLNVDDAILEGYFPKLSGPTGGGAWSGRPSGGKLQGVAGLHRLRKQLLDCIKQRHVLAVNGSLISLNNNNGIEIIGNMIQGSFLSPNRNLYGNLHSKGHKIISQIHDPDGRFMEPPGVMADTATAVRDPIFFTWHSYINFIFDQHKRTLAPYTRKELGFHGLIVSLVQVKTIGAKTKNKLFTFWEQAKVKLDIDFSMSNKMEIFADITRLQNMPFTYQIDVVNSGVSGTKRGTVRIFLMPSFGENGQKYYINQQKAIAIEMDRFSVEIPAGKHTFTQDSRDSYVTRPRVNSSENQCGCGWPQHLLLPKGNKFGLEAKVFVIITDNEQVIDVEPAEDSSSCVSSFCGVRGNKYPTKLPMGFPFDRIIRGHNIVYLDDFVNLYPNMFAQNVTITFTERNSWLVSEFRRENMLDANKTAILAKACHDNRSDVVTALLDMSVPIDLQINTQGDTCLHFATRRNLSQLANLLVSRGSDINARNHIGRTPLINAIWSGNAELAEVLIAHNADLHARDKHGDTALKCARKMIMLKTVNLLESKGARL